jgi:hypothetical protein
LVVVLLCYATSPSSAIISSVGLVILDDALNATSQSHPYVCFSFGLMDWTWTDLASLWMSLASESMATLLHSLVQHPGTYIHG